MPGRSGLTTKNAICDALINYYQSSVSSQKEFEDLPKDVLYELMKHMTYVQLKNLCTSSKWFASMCETPYIKKLTRFKYALWLIEHRRGEFYLGPLFVTISPHSNNYGVTIGHTSFDVEEKLQWVLNYKNKTLTRFEMERLVEQLFSVGFIPVPNIASEPLKRKQIKPIQLEQSGFFK